MRLSTAKLRKRRQERELLWLILLGVAIASLALWPVAQLVASYYDHLEEKPLVNPQGPPSLGTRD